MSSWLKIGVLATGAIVAVCLTGYGIYQHTRKPSVASPPKRAPASAVLTVTSPAQASVAPAAEENHTTLIERRLISPDQEVENFTSLDESDLMNILDDKHIIIQGVFSGSAGKTLQTFTDGLLLSVTPEMTEEEREGVVGLQNLITESISVLAHTSQGRKVLVQKSLVGRYMIKTFTENTIHSDGTGHVLVQITAVYGAILSNLRTIYLYVERDGFLTSTEDCDPGSAEWLAQTDVLSEHITYAFQNLSSSIGTELQSVFSTMRSHFLILARRLHASVVV